MDHIKVDMNEEDEFLRTLFCGNVSEKVTEELLFELFLQAGPLEKVSIVPQKTFAFITFLHAVSVQYSIRMMEGVQLFGRTLKLQPRSREADEYSRAKFLKHLEWNEKLNQAYMQDQQKEFYKKYQMNLANSLHDNLKTHGQPLLRFPQHHNQTFSYPRFLYHQTVPFPCNVNYQRR